MQTTGPATSDGALLVTGAPGFRALVATPGRRRMLLIAVVGAAYFLALAWALHLAWYPQGLPGYVYLGAMAVIGSATIHRWPLETLTNVTALTAYMTLGPLPPELWGIHVRPPESLAPLAIVVFLTISHRGPVFASAATFGTLSLLVLVPWRDIVQTAVADQPLGTVLLLDTGTDRSILAGELAACALVVLLAVMLRRQRHATAELAAKNRELVALRAAEVARIAERERARIARDVHDEVAHHVAALVIQAQAALRVSDRDPAGLARAMRDITVGGQDVLARIRSVVRVLKAVPADGEQPERTLAAELGVLFDRLRAIGYTVDDTVQIGDEVPDPQRSAIVGIVQESLTNVMLHSSARRVRVAVARRAATWDVAVADPGPAQERFPDVPRGGSGIPSMQDRVAALGGRVTTGADGPGWVVRATLPRDVAHVRAVTAA